MKTHRSLHAAVAALVLLTVSAFADDATVEKAAAALKAGDLAAAETLLTPHTGAANADAAALNLLSQVRVSQKQSKEAIALAERAVALAPDKADFHAQLGAAIGARMGEVGFMQQAMLSGRLKGAFAKAVELDPQHVGGLIGLTRYYTNAPEIAGGSLVKAREMAERVRALVPALGEIELGRIAERGENWSDALAHYEAAIAARPDSPGMLVAAGRMLVRLDRKEEARARFEAALKLNPNSEPAQKALAALDSTAAH